MVRGWFLGDDRGAAHTCTAEMEAPNTDETHEKEGEEAGSECQGAA